ncbi:MAG: hypothetical protein ABSA76_12895 [Bacteroidales bacterium]
MQNMTSTLELKNAIQLLEAEQAENGHLLKEQFFLVIESLKPVNLLKSAIKDISSSPYLVDNIVGTAMGLATGYLSKGMFVGTSGNKIKKLIGTILQFGITNVIAQNSDSIKLFGRSLFQHFFRKKEIYTKKP